MLRTLLYFALLSILSSATADPPQGPGDSTQGTAGSPQGTDGSPQDTDGSPQGTDGSPQDTDCKYSAELSKVEIKDYTEKFNAIDKDDDGKISDEDLMKFLKDLLDPPTDDEVENIVKKVHTDGDHQVTLEGFLTAMKILGAPITLQDAQDQFNFFDVDENGSITLQEMKEKIEELKILKVPLTEKMEKELISAANTEEGIKFEEFKKLWKRF